MPNKFHDNSPLRWGKGGKGAPSPANRKKETEMPMPDIGYADLPGKASNIAWGNKDPKVKAYPQSKGL